MRKGFIALCAASALVLAGSATPALAQAKGLLDGRTFAGTMGEKGKTTGDSDELHFANGKFHSTACDQYGFREATYTATVGAAGAIEWTAQATSDKEGKIDWRGTVQGDTLKGTFVWTKPGQKPIEYWVTASAKK